ncbi:hypothetical protein BY996DRAFT_6497262 [Phakopsora pachyrhizi]|nr:hypothetical protein BY996DRAFT_6497262 [Phakopsora pachyrhizi]
MGNRERQKIFWCKNMIKHIIEIDQWNIQLFHIKDPKPGLGILSKLLSINTDAGTSCWSMLRKCFEAVEFIVLLVHCFSSSVTRRGGECSRVFVRRFCWILQGFEEEGVVVEVNRWRHWKEEQKLGGGVMDL